MVIYLKQYFLNYTSVLGQFACVTQSVTLTIPEIPSKIYTTMYCFQTNAYLMELLFLKQIHHIVCMFKIKNVYNTCITLFHLTICMF